MLLVGDATSQVVSVCRRGWPSLYPMTLGVSERAGHCASLCRYTQTRAQPSTLLGLPVQLRQNNVGDLVTKLNNLQSHTHPVTGRAVYPMFLIKLKYFI